MNAPLPSIGRTQSAAPPRPPRRGTDDHAFLPAALETIETPASPVRLAMLVAICALFAAAILWSFIGRVDVMAIAAGRIQPTGRVSAIQAAESGRVVAIDVANGRQVTAGAALIALDPRQAAADLADVKAQLASARAEAIRRRAALAAAEGPAPAMPSLDWSADIPAAVREREQRVLDGDIGKLAADLAANEAQSAEKEAELSRLEDTIAAQQALIATQGKRVDMRTELVAREAGSKAQLIDAEETRQLQQVTLAAQQGQLDEARAALQRLAREHAQIVETFIAENGQKLADVEEQIDEAREKLAKAEALLEQTTIRAPISGTVTALAVTGTGQVVSTGQEVMRIVPDGSTLELEAYVSNRDIGFVHEGQGVAIKIDAFPFTRYGVLEGRVKQVAHDAVANADVGQRMVSPAAAPRSTGAGGTQAMQDLVFPVTIEIDRPSIEANGVTVPLSPGMTAVAEIKTGSRRIIEYLFSPLVEVGSEAMRER